jgi:hypothetical protein
VQLAQLLFLHRRRRVHHQILRLLVQRKGDHLADVVGARQQHDDAVDARRHTRVRRRPVAESVEQAAKLPLHFPGRIAGDLEGADHDLRPMVPHGARAELHTIDHDVVLVGEDIERVLGIQRL